MFPNLFQTLSQNSGSAKDSDCNSYDSPTSSPRHINKLIQSDEIIKPVSAILEQMKHKNKLSEDIYVKKSSTTKDIFEPSRKPSDEIVVKDKKLTETLFGPKDLEKPVPVVPEETKPVNNPDKQSSKDNTKVPAEKVCEKIDEKSVSVPDEEKQVTLPSKPVNMSTMDGKLVNPIPDGKPQIAAKPVLGQKFFDKPVTPLNLRAVLQNGLNLKTTFKLRPMLSLSR
jgi:hypothetical protein